MVMRGFRLTISICKFCNLSIFAGLWILLLVRINYRLERVFSINKDKSNESHYEDSVKEQIYIRNITTNSQNKMKLINDKLDTVKPKVDSLNLEYPLFQPTEEKEFPTIEGHSPRIPHIIHQVYVNEMIPQMYISHVKSFIEHNPSWEYRFWTDESGRRLLQKYHPYLVQVYDKFGNNIRRSDLLRYAVLYEYGGFYADLDIENLRSLNVTTIKYACIIPVEPFEHSAILYNMDFLMNNAIMSCRPKHPFFKLLLEDLQDVDLRGYPVHATGPGFVTRTFIQYNKIGFDDEGKNKTDWTSNSPYFYKGELKENDPNSVYVPNSQYFMDKIDPIHVTKGGMFTRLCRSNKKLSYRQKRACSELKGREIVRRNRKYTFTVHHWYHLWGMTKSTVNKMKKVNIRDVVPSCILYRG